MDKKNYDVIHFYNIIGIKHFAFTKKVDSYNCALHQDSSHHPGGFLFPIKAHF